MSKLLVPLIIVFVGCAGSNPVDGNQPPPDDGSPTSSWVHKWEGGTADAIGVDRSGNAYVAGHTSSSPTSTEGNVLLLKYDPTGNLLWQKSYSQGAPLGDQAAAIATDSEGNIYVAGYTNHSGENENDVLLLKYDPDGNLLMQRAWDGMEGEAEQSWDYAKAIALDSSGNIYLAGHAIRRFDAPPPFYFTTVQDVVLLKYTAAGDLEWQRTWGGDSDDWAFTMVLDADGYMYVAGATENSSGLSGDLMLLKCDLEGNLVWQKAWDSTQGETAYAIDLGSDGAVYVAGTIYDSSTGHFDTIILKSDSEGNVVWQIGCGGAVSDYAYSLVLDGKGSIYVAGYIRYASGSEASLWKYDLAGNLQVSYPWNWSGEDPSVFNAIAVDGTGDLYFAGEGRGSSGSWEPSPDPWRDYSYSVDGLTSTTLNASLRSVDCESYIPAGSVSIPNEEPDREGAFIIKYSP